ncbi:MAG: hypothetical protein ACXWF8_18915 [Methylobacter sp.]
MKAAHYTCATGKSFLLGWYWEKFLSEMIFKENFSLGTVESFRRFEKQNIQYYGATDGVLLLRG